MREDLIAFLVERGLAEEERGYGHAAADEVADAILEKFIVSER